MDATTNFLRTAVERRYRDFRAGAAASAATIALGAVALGFATTAAFGQLSTIMGPVAAATVTACAYAAATGLILAVRALRRRATRSRDEAAPSMSSGAEGEKAWRMHPGQVSAVESDALLMQALKLGSELSTMQLLFVALFGGFVAGRNIRK